MKVTVHKDKFKISSSLRTEQFSLFFGGVEGPYLHIHRIPSYHSTFLASGNCRTLRKGLPLYTHPLFTT